MAGTKGKSGGARRNSGGARPGAGRPRKPPAHSTTRDPLEFLLDVMQSRVDANANQVRAAIAAIQYMHRKKGDGKKEEAADAARKAASGKFAPSAPPKLH